MRWMLWLVLAVLAMHHVAMSTMSHDMASAAAMAHATVAKPELCRATAAQPPSTACADSCAMLQAANLARWPGTLQTPATPSIRDLQAGIPTSTRPNSPGATARAVDDSLLRRAAYQVLRI